MTDWKCTHAKHCCYPREMFSHLRWIGVVGMSALGPLLGSACGAHAANNTTEPATASAPSTRPAPKPAPARDPREVAGQAHFGDLVRLAQELDSSGHGHSESGCLLRGTEPLHFEADLSLSVRPLPPVSEHAKEVMDERSGVLTVVSPWGTVGAAQSELADAILLPFTTTSPGAVKLPTVALFAARDGVYLRAAKGLLPGAPASALSPDEAGSWLARIAEPAAVYVTAERAFELRKLTELLKRVPNRHEVGLAVALPKGTRLPAAAADGGEGLCPQGLPEPAAGDAEGSLDASAAQSALAPLREAALSCALSSGGKALLGGKLVLALRISPEGRAREACFVSDAISEPMLRRCLLSSVHDLPLPAPKPNGFADVHLPLQIELAGPKPQLASCN
jgi:hypothetical protein